MEMETVDADHNRNEIDFFFGKFLFLSFIFKQETIAPKRATGVKWFSYFFFLRSCLRLGNGKKKNRSSWIRNRKKKFQI